MKTSTTWTHLPEKSATIHPSRLLRQYMMFFAFQIKVLTFNLLIIFLIHFYGIFEDHWRLLPYSFITHIWCFNGLQTLSLCLYLSPLTYFCQIKSDHHFYNVRCNKHNYHPVVYVELSVSSVLLKLCVGGEYTYAAIFSTTALCS